MQAAIGYLRVSTPEQGRRGFSLETQRREIADFGAREGFSVNSWYQDVQTGRGADALLLRRGLAAALKEAKSARCPLIVSRLDRLSRNVHFITGLMEHKVHFIVAAFGRDCDDFVLHIYASVAEQERKMIAERLRAAAAIRKRKGEKFGLQLRSKAECRKIMALGHAALRRAATERAEAYRPLIEWALRQPGMNGRPITFRAAANKLNERNIESSMGAPWTSQQVLRTALRLGLHHPRRIPQEAARARVHAMWKRSPGVTGKQVIAGLGSEDLMGVRRARDLLREYRLVAAMKSAAHKRMGWRVDNRTGVRLRISGIWKRHPEFTAQQVHARLGRKHSVNVWYVRQILNECWRASGRHSGEQLRIGRRVYGNGGAIPAG